MTDDVIKYQTLKECLTRLLKALRKTLKKGNDNKTKYAQSSALSNIEVNLKALETALAGNSCTTLDEISIKLEDYEKLVMELLNEEPLADLGKKGKPANPNETLTSDASSD